jgi:hypothetical protein
MTRSQLHIPEFDIFHEVAEKVRSAWIFQPKKTSEEVKLYDVMRHVLSLFNIS